MGEDDFPIDEAYYPQLLRAARSAGLDLSENRSEDDLVRRLKDAGVARVGYDEWEQDGEPLELEPPRNSSSSTGPTDTTVLYCLPREETTAERVESIGNALEDAGFELRETESESENYKIVLPAEAQTDEEEEEADLEDMTRDELYELAQEQDLDGRSDMTKDELVDAIEERQAE